jgi:hypothetical protein
MGSVQASTPRIRASAGRPLALLSLLGLLTVDVRAETIVWRIADPELIRNLSAEILGAPGRRATEQGQALAFDGVSDGVIVPVNPVAGWPRFTIEVLVRPDAGGGFEQRFLHVGEPGGARALIELRLREDGRWYLDTFLRSGVRQLALLDETKLHQSGEWHWVALRYDGRTMAHFVNGQLELKGDIAVPPLPPGRTSLGVRMTRVSWFKGSIAEVRFHDAALTPTALQQGHRANGAAASATAANPDSAAR